MSLSLDDLTSGNIYLEKTDTLAARIDYAWSIYTEKNTYEAKYAALKFLIYAFDITDTNAINQQLFQFMEDRQQHQAINPNYVPGKLPSHLPFDPKLVIPEKTPTYGNSTHSGVKAAIAERELLDVNAHGRKADNGVRHPYKKTCPTIFFNDKERGAWRVHLRNGLFHQNGKPFDTSQMISHRKKGFAAFTLNANGELSVFNHNNMKDSIAHSTPNAQAPVVAAGELQIKNGVLTAITTHSGHYCPSVFNVYRFLEYCVQRKVNIDQAQVITFKNPSLQLNTHTRRQYFPELGMRCLYITPAIQIYRDINRVLNESIITAHQQVHSYQSSGFWNTIFYIKDLCFGRKLTEHRAQLAAEFESCLNDFKATITDSLSREELNQRINSLKILIALFQQQNNNLSQAHSKRLASGRLAKSMSSLAAEVKVISREFIEPHAAMKSIV